MKHIECPFKLATQSLQRPTNRIWLSKQSIRLVWARMYGHILFGMTQTNPQEYYKQFNIQMEPKLMQKINDWAMHRKYTNQSKIILNKPDQYENTLITYFFADDKNIDWVYEQDNLFVNILDHKIISGLQIDRSKNYSLKDYSKTEKTMYINYKLSAKHIDDKQHGQTFNQYKIEIISNRFLQVEGPIKDDYQRHTLQIEAPVKFRLVDQFKHFYITDIDDCLQGNPHLFL